MHQLLNSPFSELTKSLIQRLHTDNSNEMELMLKSRSQKASGLEDRGYYQLDIPNGRKTWDYLVLHCWNREGSPISNGVANLSCLHIGVFKQKQSPDDFTTGSRSMRLHWWTCTASLELHGSIAHGTHSALSLKLLRRNLVWWAEYSLSSPFLLI